MACRVGFGMYFATVSLSTEWPSFASSLAILRRLQSGFSRAIRSMRLTRSDARGGRPTGRDFHAHQRAKPRRCHSMTVAGRTIASVSAHRENSRDTMTQNARSMGRSRGRGVARQRIASCWRSKRFSATRLILGRKAAKKAPKIASTSASILATFAQHGGLVSGESERHMAYPCRPAMLAVVPRDCPNEYFAITARFASRRKARLRRRSLAPTIHAAAS